MANPVTAEILSFRPSEDELSGAWAAYDEARLRTMRLYRDPASTTKQRLEAVSEENRLHHKFYRLCIRAEAPR